MDLAALILFVLGGVGLLLVGVQLASLGRHLRQPPPPMNARPAISVLKPLCGVDDELFDNLRTFIDLGLCKLRNPAWGEKRRGFGLPLGQKSAGAVAR